MYVRWRADRGREFALNDLIVAIHGAIAELVAEDPERADIAARYLPVYADPGAPGWIAWARKLLRELGDERDDALPPLDDALTALRDGAVDLDADGDDDAHGDVDAVHPL